MIRTYINNEGKEIFRLDQDGNLEITGNLTLGEEGIIKANTIDVFNNNDIIIVRNPDEMKTPYKGGAKVVYYLGDTITDTDTKITYKHNTWWEKYVLGYTCIIDKDSNADSEFIVHSEEFFVEDDGNYNYNKKILDLYPNTKKIVVTAVQPIIPEEEAHWEIKYYDKNDLLIYTDVIDSNILSTPKYYFPFSSLNASDYDEGFIDIVITVKETICALRNIAEADISAYMPLTGGTFKGIINTQNITPIQNNKYLLGTRDFKFKEGNFNSVYTDSLKTKTLEAENLYLDDFSVSTQKEKVSPKDCLLIVDSQDNFNVKQLLSAPFSNDGTKFLREDGYFTEPDLSIQEVVDLSLLQHTPGKIILYKGVSNNAFIKDTLYIGSLRDDVLQVIVEGATVNNNLSGGLIPVNKIWTSGSFSNLLRNNNINSIKDFEGDSLTFVYENDKYYIEELGTGTSINADSLRVLEDFTSLFNFKSFEFTELKDATVRVKINKLIWEPINQIKFSSMDTNKVLSQEGTWLDTLNIIDVTYTPSSTNPLVFNNASYKPITGVSILKQDNLLIGLLITEAAPLSSTHTASDVHEVAYIGNKIYQRDGYRSTASMQLDKWQLKIDDTYKKTSFKNEWRTLTKEEWEYLLSDNRGAGLYGRTTINGVNYIVVLSDSCPQKYRFYNNGEYNSYSYDDALTLIKNNNGVFLPTSGERAAVISSTSQWNIDTSKWVYWTSSKDEGSGAYYLSFTDSDDTISIKSGGDSLGRAVRLVQDKDGTFSVAPGKKVKFAPSNLQYHRLIKQYRFAPYFFSTQLTKNNDLDEWVDLFNWGTGDVPLLTSQDPGNYTVFKDWGKYNIVQVEYSNDFYLTKA